MTRNAATMLRVRNLYEEVVRWSARPNNREFMFVEPQKRLEDFCSGVSVPAGVVLTRLQFLAAWYSATTVAALVERDSASHEQLRLAHGFGLCEARLARGLFKADQRPKKTARLSRNTFALAVARAAALGLVEDCTALGRILVEEFETGLFHRDLSMVAPFVLSLFSLWQGLGPARSTSDIAEPEEYRDILASWQTASTEKLGELLERACELHLARAHEDTDDDTFEFSDHVYALYPVEILMVLRLRNERGLPLPALEHPLLSMPMGRLVNLAATERDDPLLVRVSEKIKASYPA